MSAAFRVVVLFVRAATVSASARVRTSMLAATAAVTAHASGRSREYQRGASAGSAPVRATRNDASAPAGYPNPFKDTSLGSKVSFDSLLSEGRYELVNSLYDRLVTFRLKELNAAWKAIHTAEAALAKKANAEGSKLVAEARKLASAVPVSEADANNKDIAGAFQPVTKDTKPGQRQAEFEEKWDAHAKKTYAEAKSLADKAAALAK